MRKDQGGVGRRSSMIFRVDPDMACKLNCLDQYLFAFINKN